MSSLQRCVCLLAGLASLLAAEAAAQWTALVNRTARKRPPEFFEAVYQLHEAYRKYPEAERPAMLEKARKALKAILAVSGPNLAPAVRAKLERQLDELAKDN